MWNWGLGSIISFSLGGGRAISRSMAEAMRGLKTRPPIKVKVTN